MALMRVHADTFSLSPPPEVDAQSGHEGRLSAVAVHHIAGAIGDTGTIADCVLVKVCDPLPADPTPLQQWQQPPS
jgi:hypothetical protein